MQLESLAFRAKILATALFMALFAAVETSYAVDPYYDEVFDSKGELRPAYEEIYPVYQTLSKARKSDFVRGSKLDFQGDNAVDPLLRALSLDEYSELKRGVEQRGTALRRLLQDYHSGNWKSIEQVIPRDVLERIVARSHESGFAGKVSPDSISFPYGPDIIRDSRGQWRVVEDNPGFIGGPGDLIRARQTLLERIPEYREKLDAWDKPEQFYDRLVERYRALRKPPGGRVVLYLVPPYADHEDDRLRKIFADRDVDVITPFTQKKLVTNERGVFIEEKKADGKVLRKPVGYLSLNTEYRYIDSRHPATRAIVLLDEARVHLDDKRLKPEARKAIEAAILPDSRSGSVSVDRLQAALDASNLSNGANGSRGNAKGLIDAILSGKVATNYSPGVDFIGDKEFYVYVDDLIRHYLHEEPILQNIPTRKFVKTGRSGKLQLDESLLEKVFREPQKYVIKAVDGRGGDAVWVGAKTSRENFLSVRKKILEEPTRFIVQEFTHLSVLDGKITDLRMISAVDPKGVFVSPTPWGRALPLDGDGKVNLSSAGREVAVVVVKKSSAPKRGECVVRALSSSLR